MIHFYHNQDGKLARYDSAPEALAALAQVVWIDMVYPTPEEEAMLEQALAIQIPTRADMEEIEMSSRLYDEAGALFLTANLMSLPNGRDPITAPVTFVLAEGRLVTVRYHAPRPFQTFVELSLKQSMGCTNGHAVLVALFEVIVDRLADILESASHGLEDISKSLFQLGGAARNPKLAQVLEQIGRAEDLNAKVRDSLATIDRLIGSVLQIAPNGKADSKGRVKTLGRDLRSLGDYAQVQGEKIIFLLDATLGMINIEQNKILGIFSIVAFVFLPPTLIASIYGMNFDVMPELHSVWGYPLALLAMVVSAVAPYLWFRRRGWL
jgi:magnesium transporter